ncbi:nitrite/sulfite reductase [Thioclava atlantica]|uniref:Nitrite/sulfite reductase hemoprotein beta-component ferrodoxin domain-containing protein n=1 Tax=Thioclava atlantica TaxID=1317124 RepID=A0A085TWB3_9RHOB|nr:nitrite/sulfite reductase [Thioclava atlantica]KFE35010.1 nitrite/sulfite reductase hemoprotein beta-component ferrodoxin domain-containing protein [Thioclava atlantica]
MFQPSEFDRAAIRARAAQFRAQVQRRLDGSLTEDEFKPLRLMNGLYLQLHAYMLRVAIPYGTLSATQMRQLAMIAERWDRGYGHFTTRQNVQFNWPRLVDVPEMIDALADVGMHAIQTSGNAIRNTTTDAFAGAAADEIADPRPYAELIRQWSTDHPEFQFLPRKFKIAINGARADRAAIRAHDVGLQLVEREGEFGFRVFVGGGLGRTPMIGRELRAFLPARDLLPYLEAVVAAWNLAGRRDNKYKSRIKITVHELGIERFSELVEAEFRARRADFKGADQDILAELEAQFAPPVLPARDSAGYDRALAVDPLLRAWAARSVTPHRNPDYAVVTVSLKEHGAPPGDASAAQMRLLADLAERYGQAELRISHEQNVVLPHIAKADLPVLFEVLRKGGLATANIGLISDIIACPGMDYCALATARSIPLAQQIATHFRDLGLEEEIGALKIKISGCINACGHHHLGHIGILGLDRAGVENYQITLGGDASETMALGDRAGPGFAYTEVIPAIERLLRAYLELRDAPGESFLDTLRRLGAAPFKDALYQETQRHAAQ